MPKKIETDRFWKITNLVIRGVIGVIYVAFGFLVIDKKWFVTPLDSVIAYALGILLIIYGAFRMYRAFKAYRE